MPLFLSPLTLGTFADITQVPEYESVFLRPPEAMKCGACRRACKAQGICAALPVGHSTSAGHSSQVGNWSGKTASFMRTVSGFEGINLRRSLQVVVNVDDNQCKFYDGS